METEILKFQQGRRVSQGGQVRDECSRVLLVVVDYLIHNQNQANWKMRRDADAYDAWVLLITMAR